jgi:hypothetical protein
MLVRMVERSDDVEIVTLRLGFDAFEAGIAAEACRDQGLTVELLRSDDQGALPGNQAAVPHRLLVRSDELADAQRILARSGYDPEHG